MKNNLSGKIFNNLKVLEFSRVKNSNSHWICECLLCGKTTEVSRPNLRSGNTKDCGCIRSKKISDSTKTHGMSKSSTWKTWASVNKRIREGSKHSPVYGKIDIDPAWVESFERFYEDMGERPTGRTLDRIDNTKGYWKYNCRWATPSEQNRNKSSNVILTFNGKSMCAIDWANELGIHRDTIRRRLKRGLPISKVLESTGKIKK